VKFHLDCQCACDVLVVEKLWEEKESARAVYYFNMYRSHDKRGFLFRLKCAWEYFRRGEFAYSDMTVDDRDLERLIDFLQKAKLEKPGAG